MLPKLHRGVAFDELIFQNSCSFPSAIESISQEPRDHYAHESRSVVLMTCSCFRLTLLRVAGYLESTSTDAVCRAQKEAQIQKRCGHETVEMKLYDRSLNWK